MILALAAMAAVAAAPAVPPAAEGAALGARMRESAAAAEAFQGELDGSWRLEDANHRTLFVLQLTEPAGGGQRLEGAWRAASGGSALGPIDAIERRGGTLSLRFAPAGGAPTTARLIRRTPGVWSGSLTDVSGPRRVSLVRPVGGAPPP